MTVIFCFWHSYSVIFRETEFLDTKGEVKVCRSDQFSPELMDKKLTQTELIIDRQKSLPPVPSFFYSFLLRNNNMPLFTSLPGYTTIYMRYTNNRNKQSLSVYMYAYNSYACTYYVYVSADNETQL